MKQMKQQNDCGMCLTNKHEQNVKKSRRKWKKRGAQLTSTSKWHTIYLVSWCLIIFTLLLLYFVTRKWSCPQPSQAEPLHFVTIILYYFVIVLLRRSLNQVKSTVSLHLAGMTNHFLTIRSCYFICTVVPADDSKANCNYLKDHGEAIFINAGTLCARRKIFAMQSESLFSYFLINFIYIL